MAGQLFAGLIFSSIGFVAMAYGKSQSNFKMMALGLVLMAYPYFVVNTIALYGIGVALTGAVFFVRDG